MNNIYLKSPWINQLIAFRSVWYKLECTNLKWDRQIDIQSSFAYCLKQEGRVGGRDNCNHNKNNNPTPCQAAFNKALPFPVSLHKPTSNLLYLIPKIYIHLPMINLLVANKPTITFRHALVLSLKLQFFRIVKY